MGPYNYNLNHVAEGLSLHLKSRTVKVVLCVLIYNVVCIVVEILVAAGFSLRECLTIYAT